MAYCTQLYFDLTKNLWNLCFGVIFYLYPTPPSSQGRGDLSLWKAFKQKSFLSSGRISYSESWWPWKNYTYSWYNLIKELDEKEFGNLIKLPEKLFENLTTLRELYVDGNPMKALHENLFENLVNLEGIWIIGSRWVIFWLFIYWAAKLFIWVVNIMVRKFNGF